MLSMTFMSCDRLHTNQPDADEPVSLQLLLSVPELSITTKGLADPWDEDFSDWTNWDMFTDGRNIYEVTILIIDEATGALVGFRDMYAYSEYTDDVNGFWDGFSVMDESTVLGTSAKISFLYDRPQGGRTIEQLKRGFYQVLAVSNYRPLSAEFTGTVPYDGLKELLVHHW